MISTDGNMKNIILINKRHNYEIIKTIPSMIHTCKQFVGDVYGSDKCYRNISRWHFVKVFAPGGFECLNFIQTKFVWEKKRWMQFMSSIISEMEAIWFSDENLHSTPATFTMNFNLEYVAKFLTMCGMQQ